MPNVDHDLIRLQQSPECLTFAVFGRGTMRQCPALNHRARQALESGQAVRVELCACSYLDSTFMGTLLGISRAAKESRSHEFTLVAPSPECKALIEQMGLDRLIPIATPGEERDDPWEELPVSDPADATPAMIQETVVRAHENLAQAPGPAAQPFKAIAAKLAAAWNKQKTQ